MSINNLTVSQKYNGVHKYWNNFQDAFGMKLEYKKMTNELRMPTSGVQTLIKKWKMEGLPVCWWDDRRQNRSSQPNSKKGRKKPHNYNSKWEEYVMNRTESTKAKEKKTRVEKQSGKMEVEAEHEQVFVNCLSKIKSRGQQLQ